MNKIFPLIRHFSRPISAILVKFPVTPNQITTAGLLMGILGSICFINSSSESRVIGSLIFLVSYILDNCDGEIARRKNLTSAFGEKFDTFVDWIVHTVFFSALGYGTAQETGNYAWLWVSLIASIGATINYFLVSFVIVHKDQNGYRPEANLNQTATQKLIFIFREIFRSDFCFIVLILAVINYHWLLIPAGAIGSQVYWIIAVISYYKK